MKAAIVSEGRSHDSDDVGCRTDDGSGDLACTPRTPQSVLGQVHHELGHIHLHGVEKLTQISKIIGIYEYSPSMLALKQHLQQTSLGRCVFFVMAQKALIAFPPPENRSDKKAHWKRDSHREETGKDGGTDN
mmetsp:Transcript_9651/g.21002  ORF Transcript_9651/g.21002 Transcript_9651/m.21002 type:complete len:132 (-) Transcript_9651:638-1033(-)